MLLYCWVLAAGLRFGVWLAYVVCCGCAVFAWSGDYWMLLVVVGVLLWLV